MPARRAPRRIFSYDDALATFPLVRDLTAAAVRQFEAVLRAAGSRQEEGGEEEGTGEEHRQRAEEACDRIVQIWTREVTALGCEVKGRWLVDWDSGDGYYCWRFPEQTIGHFHTYEEGFAGRVPVN